MADWFASWFNTKYYHMLYGNRNEHEAKDFIDKLVDVIDVNPDSYLLDLCCGKGRHSRYLNEKGFSVKGVDLSDQSIEFAKQFENETLNFEIHDMRDQMAGVSFDVVLNLFTSFGYFENQDDNQKVISSVNSYLKKGGIFVIDFLNVKKVIDSLPVNETKSCESIDFKINKTLENGFIIKTIEFTDGDDYNYQEKVAALEFDFFEKALENEGFEITDVYGSYDLDSFDVTKSDRLIIKATKK